ncbi:Gfo/Idh/MocA family protein [Pedococcus sp. 5OH_020]|uniref:Gfo/Idh/MocA family protein n=1 Tax=Pedococcus sp. 5OH_020 TaxID=2989814 RepID=UPI0022E99B42|nr:Gfo/Idh/MocA family oxidoreductase [Pedococcus sp. 5OH_020]
MVAPRVALLGAHGHGEVHLRNIKRLALAGRATLAGVADPRPPTDTLRDLVGPGTAWVADARTLLEEQRPDVTVVCTPIPLHLSHAQAALAVGSALLLEKPPTSTLADFHALAASVTASGLACQVGFQALGSHALEALCGVVASGQLGTVSSIGVLGEWVRDASYFSRAPWAGRREVDGTPTLDGAVSNPFAHGVAAALALDDSQEEQDLVSVEADLLHANPVETDDTSTVRIRTRRGTVITVAVTLCAQEPREPRLLVRGDRGHAELVYTTDELAIETGGVTSNTRTERTDLLEDLLDHLEDPSHPLISPLARSAAFMAVMEQVRTTPTRAIDSRWTQRAHVADLVAVTVPNVQETLRSCVESSLLLRETPTPWARETVELSGGAR